MTVDATERQVAAESRPMSPAEATDAVLTDITRGIGVGGRELFAYVDAHYVCHPKQEEVLVRKARICDEAQQVVCHLTQSMHPRIAQPGERKSASVFTYEISIRGRVHTLMIQFQPGDESRILSVDIEDDGTLVTPDEKWHLDEHDVMRSTLVTELLGVRQLIEGIVAQRREEAAAEAKTGE